MKLNNRIVAFLMSALMVWNSASAPLSVAYEDQTVFGGPVVASAQEADGNDSSALEVLPESTDEVVPTSISASSDASERTLENTVTLSNGHTYHARVTAGANAAIPNNAELEIKAYDDDSDEALSQEELAYRLDLVKKGLAIEEENNNLSASRLLNLTIVSDDKTVELSGAMKVEIETDDFDVADDAAIEVGYFDWEAKQPNNTVQQLSLQNKAENPPYTKLEFETERLGDFALACVAHGQVDSAQQGEPLEEASPADADAKRLVVANGMGLGAQANEEHPDAIARVSNDDGATWTYYERLVTADGKTGAFTYANGLTGSVVIETLSAESPYYVLGSQFTFDKSGLTSLTLRTADGVDKSTLRRSATNARLIYFNVSKATLTVENMRFEGVDASGAIKKTNQQGGIFYLTSAGSTFRNVDFKDCQSGAAGGAIYANSGKLNVVATAGGSSTFEGCTSTDGGAIFANGGNAVCLDNNEGAILFKNCATSGSNYEGGAVYVNSGGFTAKNNTGSIGFEGCYTTGSSSEGSAVFVYGGSFELANIGTGTASFTNCHANASDGGGAICMWSDSGKKVEIKGTAENPVVFKDCKNTCTNAGNGGAICQNAGASMTLENVTFTDCSAYNVGGAVRANGTLAYTNTGTGEIGFYNCTSKNNEGGAAHSQGAVTVSNAAGGTIKFNDCSATKSDGGAISTDGRPLTVKNSGTVSFVGCDGKTGGAICTHQNSAVTLQNAAGSVFECVNCTGVEKSGAIWTGDFKAQDNAGEIRFNNCIAQSVGGNDGAGAGAVYVGKSFILTNAEGGKTEFTDCSAQKAGANGGAILLNKANGATGSIVVAGTEANPVTFAGCSAPNGKGGTIYQNTGNQLSLSHVAITGSSAQQGGAIYTQTKDVRLRNTVNITDGKLAGTVATNGAGIYLQDDEAIITIESDADAAHITVSGNTTSDGQASNIYTGRLAPAFEITAKSLAGKIGVTNAAASSRWLGRSSDQNVCGDDTTLATTFLDDAGAYTAEYRGNGYQQYWKEGTQEQDAACKITDGDGRLLRYAGSDAVFPTIAGAFSAFEDAVNHPDWFTDASGNQAVPQNIEMLVDARVQDVILRVPNSALTLKSASATPADGKYPGTGNHCVITRGSFLDSMYIMDGTDDFTLEDVIIDGNNVTSIRNGGIIRVGNSGCKLTLKNAELRNGRTSANGGAIYAVDGASLTMNDSAVSDCVSGDCGGGLYLAGKGGAANITKSTFTACTLASTYTSGDFHGSGGAIYSGGRALNVTECRFDRCKATNRGGGIGYYGDSPTQTLTIKGSRFVDCETTLTITTTHTCFGAGVFVDKGGLVIGDSNGIRSRFEKCKVNRYGGAVLVYGAGAQTIAHTDFVDCSCKLNNGGAYYTESSRQLSFNDCTFTRCRAGSNNGSGGAIYEYNTSESGFTVEACTFDDCAATAGNGGAVYGKRSVTLKNCAIRNGCTAKNGAAAYAEKNLTMDGGTITGNAATAGGALGVNAATCRLYFKGNAVVTGNTWNGSACNVYLNFDTDEMIQASGLSGGAKVGVYVVDGYLGRYGKTGRTFGRYSGEAQNLNAFVSDREVAGNGGALQGAAFAGNRVCWPGEPLVLTVTSASDKTTPVVGARFSIERIGWDDKAETIFMGVTDADGKLTIPWQSGTLPGEDPAITGIGGGCAFVWGNKYVLRQTRTQAGYALPGGHWDISIDGVDGPQPSAVQAPGKSSTPEILQDALFAWSTTNTASMAITYDLQEGAWAQTPAQVELVDGAYRQVVNFSAASSAIPEAAPTKAGFDFLEWNSKPDGTGSVSYQPGDEIRGGTESTVTLYAIWAEAKYVARVIANDGTVTYHEALEDSGSTTYNGKSVKKGAFDYAKTLAGNVVIETFKTAPGTNGGVNESNKYVLTSKFTFDKSGQNLTIRTMPGIGFTSTIQKNLQNSLFVVKSVSRLTVEDLSFEDVKANGNENGGIFNISSVHASFTDSTFTNCAVNGKNGGAIYFDNSSGVMEVYGCTFNACKTIGTGNSGNNGGAIYFNSGTKLVVDRSQKGRSAFVDCVARRYGGGYYFEPDGGIMDVRHTDFIRCQANPKGQGGNGGGFGTDSPSLTAVDCVFEDCTCAYGNGGGVWQYRDNDNAPLRMALCEFRKGAGASSTGCQAKNGGALYAHNRSEISNTVFTDCWASESGGALYAYNRSEISNTVFTDCWASESGGSLYARGSNGNQTLEVRNCTFDGHEELDSARLNATADGGAINVQDGFAQLYDCEFKDLTAGDEGGAVYLYPGGSDKVEMKGCSFDGHDTLGTDVRNAKTGGGLWIRVDTGSVKDTTFVDCSADNGGGMYAYSAISTEGITARACRSTNGVGGGVYFLNTATMTGTNSFSDCSATGNGGGVYFSVAEDDVLKGELSFENCLSSAGRGGGAYFAKDANLKSSAGLSFLGCHANSSNASNGGGGAWFAGTVTLNNKAIFTNCSTNANGGGLYAAGNCTMSGTRLTGCSAAGNGGGVCAAGDVTLQSGTQIIGGGTTSAAGKGSALYLSNAKNAYFYGGVAPGTNGVKISDCTTVAPEGGAVEYASGAKLHFEGNAYVHNNRLSGTGDQRNVVLAYNNKTAINTTSSGLGEDAAIGVFATDAQLAQHGEKYTEFGTFATNKANLDAFMNDRRPLVGGEKGTDTIAWTSAYNLVLDPNGGEGTTISVMLTYFKEYTLGTPFTKDGYHFAGWNTRKDGTGDSYMASDVVSQLTEEDGGTVTLYAQWEDYTACEIRFHPNGGTDVPSREVKPGTTLGLLPSSAREHYTFVRWMLMKNGVEESYSQNTVVNEDMNFYALWEKKVAITFDAQGGIVGEDVREMAPGRIGTLPKTEQPAATKRDYEFVRWYTLGQDGSRYTVTANTEFTKDATVYAEWKVIPRRLRYNTNGGYPGKNYATNDYWYDSDELTDLGQIKSYAVQNPPSVTNHGYELDGWFVGSTRISNGSTPIDGVTVDLRTQNVATAHWKKLEWVTVTFDSDGGSTCNSISVYKGDTIGHYPEPTKKNHSFIGWYLLNDAGLFAKDSEGNDIEVGAKTPINEDTRVKAKWESYATISFDSAGGSACTAVSVERGGRVKDFPKPTRDGYAFAGWYTNEGTQVTDQTVIEEDLTVTARWNELVTVTFDWTDRTDENGSPIVTTATVEKGKALSKIPGTYREGYVLEGWYPDAQFAGEALTLATAINEDTTYYAKWCVAAVERDTPVEYECSVLWTDESTNELENLNDCLSWYLSGSPSKTVEAHAYVHFALKETQGKVFPEGSIQIKVPKYVFEDWNGNKIAGTNNIVDLFPKAPNKSKVFRWNYLDAGDYYILQNSDTTENVTLDLKITYSANIQNVKAARIDAETGQRLDANGDVLENDDYAPRSNVFTITAKTDGVDIQETRVLSTAAYKTYTQTTYTADFTRGSASVRRTWNDAWGTKPADADDYYYVVWTHGGFAVRSHGDFAGSTAGLFQTTSKDWEDDAYDVVYTDPAGNYVVTRHPYTELTGSRKTLYKKEVVKGSWIASGLEETGKGTIPCEIDFRVYEPYTPPASSESVASFGASKDYNYYPYSYKGYRTGQDALLDDETIDNATFTLWMQGPGGAGNLEQKGDTNLYYAKDYTMVMRDGSPGDVTYYSSRENRHVRLGDNDYSFTRLSVSMENWDGYKDDDGWHSLSNTAYSSWRPVEVWLRRKGETDYYRYTDVYITSGSAKTVVLPADTVGFEIRHSTFYWKTSLNVVPTLKINPTTHVKNLVRPDYLAKVTSQFHNKATYSAVSAATGEQLWTWTMQDHFNCGKSKTGLRVSKSTDSSKVAIDNINRTQTIPVSVTGYHYNDAGRTKPIHSGVFYELLPLDTSVDESSVWVEAGSTRLNRGMVNVEYVADWNGTGRTMMIVSVGLPDAMKTSSVTMHYVLTNTYENIIARGVSLATQSAFANTSTNRETYEILPKVKRINEIADGQKIFAKQEDTYGQYIAYGSADAKFREINVASSGFFKAVNTLNAYEKDASTIAQTPYTYRLTYGQSDYAQSSDIVLYDLIDRGKVSDTTSQHYGHESEWQGTFESIRIPDITSNGRKCNPVVYYSSIDTTEMKGVDDLLQDLSDTSVWSTTKPSGPVTAVAIDFTKDIYGDPFNLIGEDSIVAYLTMTSPANEELNGKTAVNTSCSTSKISTIGMSADSSVLKDQTTVTMKPVEPQITLTSTPTSGLSAADPKLLAYKDTLTYDIAITNPDSAFAYRNISLEDMLPEGVTPERGNIYVYVGNADGSPSPSVKIGRSSRVSLSLEGDASNHLGFTVGELLPGETLHIAVPCIVSTKEGKLENQATLTGVNGLNKETRSQKTYHEVRRYDVAFGKKKLGVEPEEFLAGAHFELLDASGNKVEGWESADVAGSERHTVRIGAGEYTLQETDAPRNYAVSEPIRFSVSREGELTLRSQEAPLADRVIDLYDKYVAVDVTIENHVLGEDADLNKEFAYKAAITGLKPGETYAVGTQSFTADRSGNATHEFVLKNDQSVTLSKLPTGAHVVVTQGGTEYSASYVAKAQKGDVVQILHNGETFLKDQDLVTKDTALDVDEGDVRLSFTNVLKADVVPVRFVVHDTAEEKPVEGASFRLSGVVPAEGQAQFVSEWASTKEFKRVDLPMDASYALEQLASPQGYLPMEGTFQLVVSKEGVVTCTGGGATLTQDENGYVVTILNARQAHVEVQDFSTATDYFLAGAKLELLKGDELASAQRVGDVWESAAESGEDLYLDANTTYFVRKVSSPQNYVAVEPAAVKVTVNANRAVTVGTDAAYDSKSETITLYDRPVETLAITNKVTGADPGKPFAYTISGLKEGDTYSYTITGGTGSPTEGTLTVDAEGKVAFNLQPEQTIVVQDLPHSISILETKPSGHYYNAEWIQDDTNVLEPVDTLEQSSVPVTLNGRNAIVVTNKECVARVRNYVDGAWSDWTYFEYLATDTDDGAFDYANRLAGDVEIETLWESHDRYEMTRGFEFTNRETTSLTLRSANALTEAGKHTTLNGRSASSLLTFNTGGPVTVSDLELNGNQFAQTSDGGALNVSSGSLSLSNVSIHDFTTLGNGGAVYAGNGVEVTIDGGTTITGCRAVCGGAVYAAHEDGQSGSVVMNGGEIFGNTTTRDGHAAVEAASMQFNGAVRVVGNTSSASESAANVLLDIDSNQVIRALRLEEGAEIGVYVNDEQVEAHGGSADPFGTYSVDQNLSAFKNDRNTDLYAEADDDPSSRRIKWHATESNLTITNTIAGDYADLTRKFDVTVTSDQLAGQTVKLEGSNKPMTFDANGVATLHLGNGESATLLGLAEGTVVSVVVEDTPYSPTYTVTQGDTKSDNARNIIMQSGVDARVDITNKLDTVPVTGVSQNVIAWSCVVGISVLGLVSMWLYRRRHSA